ncbi:MAG: hypothetical protein NTZ05_06370 [Chloroflexi bacterium]|nr:hypothetical protein [Chloroflexota bacterium]
MAPGTAFQKKVMSEPAGMGAPFGGLAATGGYGHPVGRAVGTLVAVAAGVGVAVAAGAGGGVPPTGA